MKSSTVIATNRFGLGARPGDLAKVDSNPQEWLMGQLQGPDHFAHGAVGDVTVFRYDSLLPTRRDRAYNILCHPGRVAGNSVYRVPI